MIVFGELAGRVYAISNEVQSYVDLRDTNKKLLDRLALLEMELQIYQQSNPMVDLELSSNLDSVLQIAQYRYIPVNVVNNQIIGISNYITIDKGSQDGIQPDMGVVAVDGIVGVVTSVTPHFSRVISILNPNFRPNCKVKSNNYFGPLIWDGKDTRFTYLDELPKHVEFVVGDTVVTSGYSTIFPEGILVGTVVSLQKTKDDNYHSLKIKLFPDLANLKGVFVVSNRLKEEQLQLERTALYRNE